MSDPTISDLNAAYAELEHWGEPIISSYGGSVHASVNNIRICPGFKGQVKGSGATLSAAIYAALEQLIYAALEQLCVVRATVPPIPHDAAKDRQP